MLREESILLGSLSAFQRPELVERVTSIKKQTFVRGQKTFTELFDEVQTPYDIIFVAVQYARWLTQHGEVERANIQYQEALSVVEKQLLVKGGNSTTKDYAIASTMLLEYAYFLSHHNPRDCAVMLWKAFALALASEQFGLINITMHSIVYLYHTPELIKALQSVMNQVEPDSIESFYYQELLAVAIGQLGKKVEAIEKMRQLRDRLFKQPGVRYDNVRLSVSIRLAQLLNEAKQTEQALKVLQETETGTNNLSIYFLLSKAIIAFALDKPTTALVSAKQAFEMSLNQQDITAQFDSGIILKKLLEKLDQPMQAKKIGTRLHEITTIIGGEGIIITEPVTM